MAQVSVDRAIVYFKAGERPIEDVIVRNGGEETLSVTANPDIMISPGSSDEKREPTEDMLVSPKRFTLEPGGQRTVRLILKKPYSEYEQVYRVRFVPEARGFGKDEPQDTKDKKTLLKVITGMGILILVEPKEPSPNLEWKRDAGKLVVKNTGNINIFLSDGKACSGNDGPCQDITGNRLYPGNVLETATADNRTVKFRKEVRQQFEDLIIPPVN